MDFISLWMKGENSKTNFTHELWIKLRVFSSKVFYPFPAKFEVFHSCPTIYVGANWCHPWHYICECTTKPMMEIRRIITKEETKVKIIEKGWGKKRIHHCIEGWFRVWTWAFLWWRTTGARAAPRPKQHTI
jgi:hypothetical protein